MLTGENVSAWIARGDNNYSNGFVICKSFDHIKIDLPTFLWKEVIATDLKLAETCSGIVHGVTWPRQQNVGAWNRQRGDQDIDGVMTTSCQMNIIWTDLVRETLGEVLCNSPVKEKKQKSL